MATALAVLLGLVPAVHAKSPQPNSLPNLYRDMLRDYRRYAETLWHAAPGHPDMGYWGSGRVSQFYGGNEGSRAVSVTALAYAVLYADGDHSISVKDRIEPALRYEAATYNGGPLKGSDDQQWGNTWQSAMWAGNMGVAAWIVRKDLDPDVLHGIDRAVATEADIVAAKPPPSMLPGDTKAEENAWDLTAISSALLLQPNHPHAVAWNEALRKWAFNTLSSPADAHSNEIVDGKPVSEWVSTQQVFPDFSLENHNIFHPVYAMVAPATMAQAEVALKMGGLPVPDALRFNVLEGWNVLKYVALADGEWLYPQGLDWDLHDYEHIHYWTMLATMYQDPAAALLEDRTARYIRKRQLINGDGRFVGETSSLGFAREAVQAERIAFAWLMHKYYDPPPAPKAAAWKDLADSLAPAMLFPYVDFTVHRTPRGVVSFSMKNHLMAQVVPESEKHLDQPYVTTPNLETLVGGFTMESAGDAKTPEFKVKRSDIRANRQGFVISVDAVVSHGALRQVIAVASVAPGVLAYIDRVTAMQDVTVTEERGLPLGIENDDVSGNKRSVITAGGRQTVAGGSGRDIKLDIADWANVDNRLGLIVPNGRLLYRAAGKPNRAGAREDMLFGRYNNTRRTFHAGEVVAERVALVLPDASAKETARLAAKVRVTGGGSGKTLQFTAPDNRVHSLSLNADGTATFDGVSAD